MAVSFACPACKTLIQVGEETSGQTGQCPRCDRLLIIPSASSPVATLLDADGKPVPVAPPTPTRKQPLKFVDEDELPRSRHRSVERKPKGPAWPWTVGILGAIVIFVLLFSSFITLFAYRPRQARANLVVVEQRPWNLTFDGVTRGRLEGEVAILERGEIFQIRGKFTEADILGGKGENAGFPVKRFAVNLDPGKLYTFEIDCTELSGYIRLEDKNGGLIQAVGQPGIKSATIHQPFLWGNMHFVQISCMELAGLGDFTLTIRQSNLPKPAVP